MLSFLSVLTFGISSGHNVAISSRFSLFILLIVGIMIGAATSSIVSVLQFLSKAEEQQSFLLWTFGSLGGLNWTEIQILTGVLFTGSVIGIFSTKALNAWALGDNYSMSLGINIKRSRFLIIFSTSILTGAVTAFVGVTFGFCSRCAQAVKVLAKINPANIYFMCIICSMCKTSKNK